MLLTGSPMSARDAERFGLVNRVVPAEQLDKAVEELAAPILAASFDTVALGKRAFHAQLPLGRSQAYAHAGRVMVKNAQMADAQEGMRAFLEKRPPVWGPANLSS